MNYFYKVVGRGYISSSMSKKQLAKALKVDESQVDVISKKEYDITTKMLRRK